MLHHVTLEFTTITYMNARISLQNISTYIFNGIFSDATSNILSVHLRFSCATLTVLL